MKLTYNSKMKEKNVSCSFTHLRKFQRLCLCETIYLRFSQCILTIFIFLTKIGNKRNNYYSIVVTWKWCRVGKDTVASATARSTELDEQAQAHTSGGLGLVESELWRVGESTSEVESMSHEPKRNVFCLFRRPLRLLLNTPHFTFFCWRGVRNSD